ncbi:MAG: hypothetical protein H6772_04775 [Pseudomonadales bacterium]|nr:hypothetical protein [Pseudomonadales bacterium]
MTNNRIEAGVLRVESDIQIPSVTIPRTQQKIDVWKPTDEDLESGVIAVLRLQASAKIIGGNHMFWIHDRPPRRHHPDEEKHSIYWIDTVGDGANIDSWSDDSWIKLAQDGLFLAQAEAYFADMQSKNEKLRIFQTLGFAKNSDIKMINGRKIADRSLQSQYRAHLHFVDAVDSDSPSISWIQEAEIVKSKHLLPFFLNTVGELAIQRYSNELVSFGQKMVYTQTVGKSAVYDIERTVFAFDSWSDVLNSVLELYQKLLSGWLNTAAAIAENHLDFANQSIDLLQGCLPGFTFVKPTQKDKISGGIDPSVQWLVMPFAIALPQGVLQPGVLFNR